MNLKVKNFFCISVLFFDLFSFSGGISADLNNEIKAKKIIYEYYSIGYKNEVKIKKIEEKIKLNDTRIKKYENKKKSLENKIKILEIKIKNYGYETQKSVLENKVKELKEKKKSFWSIILFRKQKIKKEIKDLKLYLNLDSELQALNNKFKGLFENRGKLDFKYAVLLQIKGSI
ncbi:MAG: hypothetical protein RsTaC01_1093 [Candidatus Paraimprobicoccus trichonymphae]|uniref:Uncharacterized protein n=1 Tax=Candidatus Paraimprobicoccus trichonymphae TaxID=3033793 RepID=A0AA48I0F9_9FIRM|nr:MAG: hypothetical protein RsTaC01_1093 [Candidatus Paraimprobicoccus trichonymphae]